MIFKNNTVTMTKAEARAMLAFAGQYRSGVPDVVASLYFRDDGVCVSTNGHAIVLHASQDPAAGCNFGEKVVPRYVIEEAIETSGIKVISVEFRNDETYGRPDATMKTDRSTLGFRCVETAYVKWETYTKASPSNSATTEFNFHYLQDLALIQKASGESMSEVVVDDDQKMHVWCGTNWRVFLLGMRLGK